MSVVFIGWYNRGMAALIYDKSLSNKYQLKRLIVVVAVLAVVVLVGLWWAKVYESPSNVFWGMIENNLVTSGATTHVSESQSGSSFNEYTQFELGVHNIAYSTVTLNEDGAEVRTETIGTLSTDYTRYTALSSKSKSVAYNRVIDVWAVGASTAKGQVTDPLYHLLGQSVLGVVPYANLIPDMRQSLVDEAKLLHVYSPDLAHVTHTRAYGHRVYVYTVDISPRAYAAFMQQVVRDEGLGSVSEFNPDSYQANSQPLVVQLSIDPISRELLAVNYGDGHIETISGYGLRPTITVPTHTISATELQTRLENLSKQ
jgi:hypothetical protein